MVKIKVTIVTGRSIQQGQGKEEGKASAGYRDSVAICALDPEDLRKLEVQPTQNVKVTTSLGSVVLKAVESKQTPHPGVAFIPAGPWINAVTDAQTHSTGMPGFKGLEASVEPAVDDRVLDLEELIAKTYSKAG